MSATVLFATSATPAATDDSGALALLVVALIMAAIFVPLAYLIGRDARRHGRNPWLWGLLFLWQPLIIGIVWFFVRRKPPATPHPLPPPGWYPDPSGTGDPRWWDGARWSADSHPAPTG